MDAMSAVSSPQTNAPAPIRISTLKLKVDSKMPGAEQTVLLCLADGHLQAADGQRVFGTNIDESLVRTDRVTRNRHSFEDCVRIAFEHASVHEGAGITFVTVANDKLCVHPTDLATVAHFRPVG